MAQPVPTRSHQSARYTYNPERRDIIVLKSRLDTVRALALSLTTEIEVGRMAGESRARHNGLGEQVRWADGTEPVDISPDDVRHQLAAIENALGDAHAAFLRMIEDDS